MKYRNFDLEIYNYRQEDDDELFDVRVTNSPAGEQRPSHAETMILPPKLRRLCAGVRKRQLDLTELITFGKTLADMIFPETIRTKLNESKQLLVANERLRIRLKFDALALAALPWEYVYVEDQDQFRFQHAIDGFLALDRQISIVRYEYATPTPASLDPPDIERLRVVVLLASPESVEFPVLAFDQEVGYINEAIRGLTNVRLEVFQEATVDTLLEALEQPAHVWHVAAHGYFKAQGLGPRFGTIEGEGFIVLQDEEDNPHYFPSERLAVNLRQSGVRLAVLSAAESAYRDQYHPMSGIAPALAHAGIPAIVGLQFSITDENTITFMRHFYRTLAAGQPIDAAVTNGRLAVLNRCHEDEEFIWRDWGVPVLYLHSNDDVVFPISPRRAAQRGDLDIEIDTVALRNRLLEQFNQDELALLCDDITNALNRDGIHLRVDLDIVGGANLPMQALNLIQYLQRRDLLRYLVDAVDAAREEGNGWVDSQTGKSEM